MRSAGTTKKLKAKNGNSTIIIHSQVTATASPGYYSCVAKIHIEVTIA
jgi:hypothetical protein